MDQHEPFPHAPEPSSVALGILTVIVYVAGFVMVAAWFALLLLDQPRPPAASRPVSSCSVCGLVERVAEHERASHRLIGEQSEGFVVLLAALSGGKRAATGPLYETAVLHDDGTVRIVRDSTTPQWKRGDRMKVIKGRVEPAALPAERTPSPVPPVARAP